VRADALRGRRRLDALSRRSALRRRGVERRRRAARPQRSRVRGGHPAPGSLHAARGRIEPALRGSRPATAWLRRRPSRAPMAACSRCCSPAPSNAWARAPGSWRRSRRRQVMLPLAAAEAERQLARLDSDVRRPIGSRVGRMTRSWRTRCETHWCR
jgi:hypothetical protein